MGTNYYLTEDTCPHCGRGDERRHIGKSAAGWCFSLHVDEDVKSLAEWQERWSKPGAKIFDEYGTETAAADMLKVITERSWSGKSVDSQEWLVVNDAERGPAGLARHRIDGRHCIGHGESTYDLVRGEFS